MANYLKIMGKLMSVLPKTEGAAARLTLGKKQLELIAKEKSGTTGEYLQKLLSGTTSPQVDIAYKAKSNYTIAGIRIRDGKKVVATGAVSVTDPGKSFGVIKSRISVGENGNILNAHGFIDGAQKADAENIAISASQRGRISTADFSSGRAFAIHLQENMEAAAGKAKELGVEELVQNSKLNTNTLQQGLDKFMGNVRLLLTGKNPGETKAAKIKLRTSGESAAKHVEEVKAAPKKHYGKHKVKRYLYHLTSEENYQSMLRDGEIHTSRDYSFDTDGVFMTDLKNLTKHWKTDKAWDRVIDNPNGFYLSLALLGQASKGGRKIVCLRIPTAKLNHDLLRVRSQQRLVSRTPKDAEHIRLGAPAKDSSLYDKRKEAIEYIYPENIPMSDVEVLGTAEIPINLDSSEELLQAMTLQEQQNIVSKVLKTFFQGQPEAKGLKPGAWVV